MNTKTAYLCLTVMFTLTTTGLILCCLLTIEDYFPSSKIIRVENQSFEVKPVEVETHILLVKLFFSAGQHFYVFWARQKVFINNSICQLFQTFSLQ